jgi:glycosyltransferase involved in cell wall biosynthesis
VGVRVVVNRLSVLGQRSGVGHATAELLRSLREAAEPGEVDLFPTGLLWRLRRLSAGSPPPAATGDGQPAPAARPRGVFRAVAQGLKAAGFRGVAHALTARALRRACAAGRYDLYHEPNHIALECDCPTLVTIHDLSVLLHPEWHPADRIAQFEGHFRRGLGQACHFLTDTDFTRHEVIRALGVAPEKVTRIHLGVRPEFRPLPREEVCAALDKLGLPPSYLLHVGTLEPRKNLLMLLRAYCDLPQKTRAACPLLLVGGWGWNAGELAEFLHGEARHRGVIHLGYLPDEQLPAVYNGARALVYPTLYEGFGFPPLEMMACGGAVLASTAEAVVETAGAGAHLIAPEDADGWRVALGRVIRDDGWYLELRRGARGAAAPFTWERTAAQTLHLYRRLTGTAPAATEPRRRAA